MGSDTGDAAAVRIPPPLLYLAAVLVGVLLHAFVLALPLRLAVGVRIGTSVGAAVLGCVLMGAAMRTFTHTGQDPKPWKATPALVSTGVFRFTRNPMYVGMALLQAAIGIGLANGWVILLIVPVLYGVFATAIRHEEVYLEGKFGDDYVEYKMSVRRWL